MDSPEAGRPEPAAAGRSAGLAHGRRTAGADRRAGAARRQRFVADLAGHDALPQPGRRWSPWSAAAGRRSPQRSPARCCSTTTSSRRLHTLDVASGTDLRALAGLRAHRGRGRRPSSTPPPAGARRRGPPSRRRTPSRCSTARSSAGSTTCPRLLDLARDTFGRGVRRAGHRGACRRGRLGRRYRPVPADGWCSPGPRSVTARAVGRGGVRLPRRRPARARGAGPAVDGGPAARGRQPHPHRPPRRRLPRPADAAGRAALGHRDPADPRPAASTRPSGTSCSTPWSRRSRG